MPRLKSAEIRMYNVGFGDCFLLTLRYQKSGSFHVLIDFGTTRSAVDGPSMLDIAKDIESVIGADSWMIVATHRHKDHMSGFSGAPWKVLNRRRAGVKYVLQPWTEKPDLRRNATAPVEVDNTSLRGFVRGLHLGEVRSADARNFVTRHQNELAKSVVDEVRFIADDNLPNRSAIENLASFGRRNRYLVADDTRVSNSIPGVKLHVLGPPTTHQWGAIRRQAKTHEEFWHLRAMSAAQRLSSNARPPLSVRRAADLAPASTAWFRNRVRQALAHQSLAIVRALDKSMNNTSLILVFEIGDQCLLFPGDAQIENWQFALSNVKHRKRLANVTFYKVGHHGSLNATPHSLWDAFANRKDRRKRRGSTLKTGLSTLVDVHGSTLRGTEVPRSKLVKDLARGSKLFRSDESDDLRTLITLDIVY